MTSEMGGQYMYIKMIHVNNNNTNNNNNNSNSNRNRRGLLFTNDDVSMEGRKEGRKAVIRRKYTK